VRALRDRIDHSELQLRDRPEPALAALAATGVVPDERGRPGNGLPARRAHAERLFVVWPDIAPLLVLLVAITGRNIETIKELPAEHRVLDGRAVEVRLTKRRRGARNWTQTVTWEIGPPGRELQTPGGLYLLVHRLCARGRRFGATTGLWSVWRNGVRAGVTGTAEHCNPFTRDLVGGGYAQRARGWITQHGLTSDTPTTTGESAPFVLDMGRLKTSIEARRARALGGHLPSAARSNTTGVLFRNYLRGDPSTQQWAREVIDEAVVDAETAALDAHRRMLAATGGALHIHPEPGLGSDARGPSGPPGDADRPPSPAVDAAWSGCADAEHHPLTGTTCQAAFLDCFHCGNCMITGDHLPRVLALLDALDQRRQQLPTEDWWARYGPVWAAITREVLPRFTPAQIDHAAMDKPIDALLDLLEQPWERP
jgi:hypothetical protein